MEERHLYLDKSRTAAPKVPSLPPSFRPRFYISPPPCHELWLSGVISSYPISLTEGTGSPFHIAVAVGGAGRHTNTSSVGDSIRYTDETPLHRHTSNDADLR